MTPKEYCNYHNACSEGTAFALRYQTMAEVWDNCQRPDWLAWMAWRVAQPPSNSAMRKLACRFIRETPLADGRTVWDLLTDQRSRRAVEVSERYADGLATDVELTAALTAAQAAAQAAARAAAWAAAWDAAQAAARAAAWAAAWDAAQAAQCRIIREAIQNPFVTTK